MTNLLNICALNHLSRASRWLWQRPCRLRASILRGLNQAAKQSTSGMEHGFTEQFANSVLESWRHSLTVLHPSPRLTYSSIAAGRASHEPPAGYEPISAAARPPE